MKRILLIAALACMATALMLSCRDEQWDKHGELTEAGGEVANSLLDAIKANPDLSSFLQALESTGTDSLLMQSNNFTVFAPTNSAWKGHSSPITLKRLVLNHIAYEKMLSTDNRLQDSALYMANGKIMYFDGEAFNGAKISSADNVAANGVLHITDGEVQLRNSVWERINAMSGSYSMVAYLKSLSRREMDMERSVQEGYYEGKPVYDTVWKEVNNFLTEVPLNNELKEYTIIVLQNSAYNGVVDKYEPYLKRATDAENVSLSNFNVCRDLVLEGSVDITQLDTAYSIDGVQLILNKPVVAEGNYYQASNGRVYILNQVQVSLRSKIKPIVIEGENFRDAYSRAYIYTRYRPAWASGGMDIMLSCSTVQRDTFKTFTGEDSLIVSRTFNHSGDNLVNTANFWIEYAAQVYSDDYEVHYVAHNDIADHAPNSYGQYMRLEQKLFVSLPGRPALGRGVNYTSGTGVNIITTEYDSWISNNYKGNLECFVSQDTARGGSAMPIEKRMRRWSLDVTSGQTLRQPIAGDNSYILEVDRSGELIMRLCNTPRLNNGSMPKGTECGMMFLDYIKLVPKYKHGGE